MSLQLILGGSGSGKTRLLYETLIQMSMEDPEGQYMAMVPEQFTLQTQKEMVALHPAHGMMNLDILSFQRLAYRVFEELAIIHPAVLDDMGKSMVLRKVAANKKRELAMFKGQLNKNGFISQLKSMISELYQYGITPARLEEAASEAESPMLRQKLQDLTVLYQGFQDYLSDQFITTEEILDVLCQVAPRSKLIQGSVVALDGYTGFTPVQYRLLGLFLTHCKKVMVTVAMDPSLAGRHGGKPQELFYMSQQTVDRLSGMCLEGGVERERDLVLSASPAPRFGRDGENWGEALDFLEGNLFRYKGKAYGKDQDQIAIWQAPNPVEEVGQVARQIQRLVRQGLRYRDVAVIAGDFNGYAKEISHQFEEAGIPYFLDDKKNILQNPMVELVRAALEVVEKDFPYEAMMRYLRIGLAVSDREELDRLDNYLVALGIRGFKKWNMPWDRTYRGAGNLDLGRLNQFRQEILGPLARLKEALGAEGAQVKDMAEALVCFLEEGRIEEQVKAWQASFQQEGKLRLAMEYGQVYGLVMDLLDRVVGLLGDEKVGKREFGEILDAGFGEIKVGAIPATVDRVVVGDITRTRLNHVKALFFLGVNDGIVPGRKDKAGLLTDMEKEALGRLKVELSPTSREEGFFQRFYLYLVMAKPSRWLVLSYASMGGDGKSLRPSSLIGEVKKLFPKLKACHGPKEGPADSLKEARSQLARGLGQWGERGKPELMELYRWFFQSGVYRPEAKRMVEGAFYAYEKKGIGKAAAKALYGPVLAGSVTRMEQYAACPYAHFLTYGLELEKRQEYELAAVDIGNLFHSSIQLCFQTMKDQGRDWAKLTGEERKELVGQCVRQVAKDYGNAILESSARNAYLAGKVERITDRTIWALAQQINKGDFAPSGFEVSFSAMDGLKAMKIPLSKEEAIHLQGRIDRLDLWEGEDQVYVKIIDYKSGSTSFDLSALYYGLQLQLVVYMDAVMELEQRKHPGKKVVPAGIFYYNINDPLIDKTKMEGPFPAAQEILKTLKMNGLVNSSLEVIRHLDREIQAESDVIPVALKQGTIQEAKSSVAGEEGFAALGSYVHEKLKGQGREILDGGAQVSPYKQGSRTGCDYCPYHPVCGFDLRTTGYGYRRFKTLKPDEVWPAIQEAKGQGLTGSQPGQIEKGGGEDGHPVDQRAEEGD